MLRRQAECAAEGGARGDPGGAQKIPSESRMLNLAFYTVGFGFAFFRLWCLCPGSCLLNHSVQRGSRKLVAQRLSPAWNSTWGQ